MPAIISSETRPETAPRGVVKPEWLGIEQAVVTCGLSRSYLYNMINAGKIKTAVLKKSGNVRGKRLIHVGSLNDFMESCVVTPEMGISAGGRAKAKK